MFSLFKIQTFYFFCLFLIVCYLLIFKYLYFFHKYFTNYFYHLTLLTSINISINISLTIVLYSYYLISEVLDCPKLFFSIDSHSQEHEVFVWE